MAIYPRLPQYTSDQIPQELQSWANQLVQQLNFRDSQIDSRPSTRVYAVTTVTEIGRPSPGDIAYSKDEEKFKGYSSATGWTDLN